MKISQDVRDYAAKEGMNEQDVVTKGLSEKADEFKNKGAQIYKKV